MGVYISSTNINKVAMLIVSYFRELFTKQVRSPLQQPIVMLFDPTLNGNKLDIKVLKMESLYLEDCPLFSELPYRFNIADFGQTGLDLIFFGQEYLDTMAINEDKRDISLETLNDLVKSQKILSNRDMMLSNFNRLIENLTECEDYLQAIIDGRQAKETSVARSIHQCLTLFTGEDMQVLEQMMLTNFNDAMLTNNLAKLQMAQISLTEKINNLFIKSLNQYISN